MVPGAETSLAALVTVTAEAEYVGLSKSFRSTKYGDTSADGDSVPDHSPMVIRADSVPSPSRLLAIIPTDPLKFSSLNQLPVPSRLAKNSTLVVGRGVLMGTFQLRTPVTNSHSLKNPGSYPRSNSKRAESPALRIGPAKDPILNRLNSQPAKNFFIRCSSLIIFSGTFIANP